MLALGARLADGTPLMTAEAVEMLREHALRDHPQEALGYVQADGSYVPLPNVSPDAERSAFIETSRMAALISSGQLRALCHSHPGGPDCPSENDMRAQVELEVPFVIVSTNGEASTPPFAWGDQLLDDRELIGLPFRHAVDDCYALIRRWWLQERGVLLPDYARNWEWWLDKTPGEKDLYRRYFADAGFREVDRSAPREGDVWLAAIRSEVPNHAGVYLDGGLALHHPSSGLPYDPMRLSKRDSIARWTPYITHWLRREL